ncbi:O-antigen ligase family protein [Citrifermentans bremense]|uniref:O-antigen ligase family protein n=1 Tax=Citrifermentans bremense TaxID=60035 RepID=UPI0004027C31|nr:O-antigen ligase family protein [Citrifermentans bremense]
MRELIFYLVLVVVCILSVKDAFKGLVCYTLINIIRPELFFWGSNDGALAFKAIFVCMVIAFILEKQRLGEAKGYYEVWCLFWYAAALLVSVLLSDWAPHPMAYYYALEMFKLFLYAWVIIGIVKNVEQLKTLQTAVFLAFTLLALWGWDQHFRGNARLEALGGNSLNDSNGIAAAFVLALPLAVAKLQGGSSRKWRVLGAVSAVLIAMAVVFTQSRGGFLGLAVCIFLYFLHSQRKVKFVLVLLLAVTCITPFIADEYMDRIGTITKSEEDRDGSAGSRIVLWQAATLMFQDKPFFGHGFMTFARAKADYKLALSGKFDDDLLNYAFEPYKVCHGTYFTLLSEAGLLVIIPYLLFLGGFLFRYYRFRFSEAHRELDPETRYLVEALAIGILSHGVSIMTIDAHLQILMPIQIVCGGVFLRFLSSKEATAAYPAVTGKVTV